MIFIFTTLLQSNIGIVFLKISKIGGLVGLFDPFCGLYMFACSIYDVRNSSLFFSYARFPFANRGSPVILFK